MVLLYWLAAQTYPNPIGSDPSRTGGMHVYVSHCMCRIGTTLHILLKLARRRQFETLDCEIREAIARLHDAVSKSELFK